MHKKLTPLHAAFSLAEFLSDVSAEVAQIIRKEVIVKPVAPELDPDMYDSESSSSSDLTVNEVSVPVNELQYRFAYQTREARRLAVEPRTSRPELYIHPSSC